jgi:sulfur relay (sulfurtransferase) DsrC/TusE family protein
MTRDEIIKLMREACDKNKVDAWSNGFWTITQDELERLATLVATAEREACAKLFESHWRETWTDEQCAAAIRAIVRAAAEIGRSKT